MAAIKQEGIRASRQRLTSHSQRFFVMLDFLVGENSDYDAVHVSLLFET